MFYIKDLWFLEKKKPVFYCNKNVTVDVKFVPCRDNDGKFNQENGRDLSVVLWRWPLGLYALTKARTYSSHNSHKYAQTKTH